MNNPKLKMQDSDDEIHPTVSSMSNVTFLPLMLVQSQTNPPSKSQDEDGASYNYHKEITDNQDNQDNNNNINNDINGSEHNSTAILLYMQCVNF